MGVQFIHRKHEFSQVKKRRFEGKKGGDAAETVAIVKDRSAQGQGNGDGEIVVNRESLEITELNAGERVRGIRKGKKGSSLKSEGAAGIVQTDVLINY